MREDIKELLKAAKTEEEAMKILADQKIELSDEELNELKGGTLFGVECAVGTVTVVALTTLVC